MKPVVTVLIGRNSIVQQSALLERLAEAWEQMGAMHWIDCFLNEERLRWKRPILLLLADPSGSAGDPAVEEIFGAVVLFEYRPFGMPTGFVVTDDAFGLHTVISPLNRREEVIGSAVEIMLERGAQLIACSYETESQGSDADTELTTKKVKWTRHIRQVPRDLKLEATYDETLSHIGRSTRTNLRRYRRRLEKKFVCEFVADAAPKVSEGELEQLNANSLNPIRLSQFKRRWLQASHHPQGFLVGLRTSDGVWLSLIGGWREGLTTVLNWQVNARGYEKDSISTAMRSFLIESEIQRGSKLIVFDGGTPTFLSHSLRKQAVCDLIVQRLSLRARLIVLARQAFGSPEFAIPALYNGTPEWTKV